MSRIAAFVLALCLAVVVPTAVAGPTSATAATPIRSAASAPSAPSTATASVSLAPSSTRAASTTDDFASDLENGVGLPPSKGKSGVDQLKRQQDSRGTLGLFSSSTALSDGAMPLEAYKLSGVVQRAVLDGERPYENAPIVKGITDSTGVRMFLLPGDPTMYDHPVGQAQLSMAYLDHYRLTGLPSYLRLAKANAQRLVDRRVESRGGWYFPYDFDFAVYGDTSETLTAPWYSGMAQGVALSAFTRLYQATGDPAWKTAADATYASLDTAPVEGEPFGSWVSSTGDLWLELYPRWPVETSERVLNGHIYAAFGVYDYAQLTGSTDAMRLYDGAVTTVTNYLMSEFRTPRWASLYSLGHRLPTISYHQKLVNELLYLQHETGNPLFTTWANTLRNDFPWRSSKGFAVITPGTRVIYLLNAARHVVRTRAVRFARTTGAPVDHRERAHGGAIMLHVKAGAYAGWWFPEAYTKTRIRGAVDVHSYDPPLQATFAAYASIRAYEYDDQNLLVDTKTVMFTEPTQTPVTKSAIVDGQVAYFLPTGDFAGYWVRVQSGLTVE